MLEVSRIRAGKWEGIWAGKDRPDFSVSYNGVSLPGLQTEKNKAGKWVLSLPIPPDLLSDGVQTFVLRSGDDTVGSFTIIAGAPLEPDLRQEISLLRAELDLLKSAFRRHCLATEEKA